MSIAEPESSPVRTVGDNLVEAIEEARVDVEDMTGARTKKNESRLGTRVVWAAWEGSVVWKEPFEYNEHSVPVIADKTLGSKAAIVMGVIGGM